MDVTAASGLVDRAWGMGSAAGNFDNDGFADLYVTRLGANELYRNRGDGSFARVTERARVGHRGSGASAAFLDADADGFLDLYVTNYLDLELSELPSPGSGPFCRWLELDVFCGPGGLPPAPEVYFRNLGDGSFAE